MPRWLKALDRTRRSKPERDVRLAYRAALRREPDQADLATYAAALRKGRTLPWLLEVLANSDEFRWLAIQPDIMSANAEQPVHALSNAPPMAVDANCSDEDLQRLWDHVAGTWSRLGETEPHWSVLTQEQFRAQSLGDAQRARFYESGLHEMQRLNAWLRRAGIPPRPDAVCAEYGCGVARVTHALARQHARVVAFDVSAPHLRLARAHVQAEGLAHVEFVHVTGRASLDALRDIDVFYSVIALQHSPPPIILDVLTRAFAALRPGGYAFFQLPTYARDYSYAASAHVGQISANSANLDMEVHFVPQPVVLDMAHKAGLAVLEVQPDNSVGNHDRWISNSFLLARR